jgi:hypothetical protein
MMEVEVLNSRTIQNEGPQPDSPTLRDALAKSLPPPTPAEQHGYTAQRERVPCLYMKQKAAYPERCSD